MILPCFRAFSVENQDSEAKPELLLGEVRKCGWDEIAPWFWMKFVVSKFMGKPEFFTIWSSKQKKTFGDDCFFSQKPSKSTTSMMMIPQGHKLLFSLAWLVFHLGTGACQVNGRWGGQEQQTLPPCLKISRMIQHQAGRSFLLEPSGGVMIRLGWGVLGGVCGAGEPHVKLWGEEKYRYIFSRKYRFYIPTRQFLYVPKKGMIFKRKFIFQTINFSGEMLVSGRVNFVFHGPKWLRYGSLWVFGGSWFSLNRW